MTNSGEETWTGGEPMEREQRDPCISNRLTFAGKKVNFSKVWIKRATEGRQEERAAGLQRRCFTADQRSIFTSTAICPSVCRHPGASEDAPDPIQSRGWTLGAHGFQAGAADPHQQLRAQWWSVCHDSEGLNPCPNPNNQTPNFLFDFQY